VLAWSAFAALTAAAVIHSSLPILRAEHPMHAVLASQRWLLIPHVLAGATALVLGPLQFSRRIRTGSLARHRWIGTAYVCACLVAAPLALLMALDYPAFFPYSVAVNSTLWIVTTAVAWVAARRRRIDVHRRWMARSYAMATTFVLSRVPLPIPGYDDLGLEAASYLLLVITVSALLVAELLTDWPGTGPVRP
jgi:uncharacterized membrane protein